MEENLLIGLSAVIVIGIAAQWLAWRLRLPSILLLLISGFLAGPILGVMNPDHLFGDLLLPLVSLSVAVILFEGGLSLKISELRATGLAVQRLITVGTIVTWFAGAAAAHYLLGLEVPMAVLLGAILVVSGPTVIIPLLRHVRPVDRVASVLRWEGILIDPMGAILAVLVYEAIVAGRVQHVPELAVIMILKTLLVGTVVGGVSALILVLFLKKYWIPDFLQIPVTLMIVVASYTVSNIFQVESGLLTVTIMGAVLANQPWVSIKHIMHFKENLRVLLISGLFILLAARVQAEELANLDIGVVLFLLVLIFLVRPAAVLASTLWSGLNWREKGFISFVAPRGIVAAAVASVFSLRLVEAGYSQASLLLPLTFMVIIGTVTFYGIAAPAIAKKFHIAQPNPQGALIIGAHSWAIFIAKTLHESGYRVVVTDTNPSNVLSARMEGLPVYYGSGLSETAIMDLDLNGIGRMMALTPNNGVNSLAVLHFAEVFDRSELYQLVPPKEEKEKKTVSKHLRGRYLFGEDINYGYLAQRFASGAVLKKTRLTEEFDYDAFKARYGDTAVPLFLVTETGNLVVFTTDKPPSPKPGHTLISLVEEEKAEKKLAEKERKKAEEEEKAEKRLERERKAAEEAREARPSGG